MVDSLKLIAITPEVTAPAERDIICHILDNGFDFVHIRKPEMTVAEMEEYLLSIPPHYRSRLTLHDCHAAALVTGVGGLHLNGRNPKPIEGFSGRLSKSCHSVSELEDAKSLDYAFLSPIYNSISKVGYESNFSFVELNNLLAQGILNDRVFALGGITAEKLPEIKSLGFGGAAFLGYIFNSANISELDAKLKLINKDR